MSTDLKEVVRLICAAELLCTQVEADLSKAADQLTVAKNASAPLATETENIKFMLLPLLRAQSNLNAVIERLSDARAAYDCSFAPLVRPVAATPNVIPVKDSIDPFWTDAIYGRPAQPSAFIPHPSKEFTHAAH